MKTIINHPGLVVLALGGLALAGCDSVKDVRERPTYELPPEKVALTGRITGVGVGTTRPLGLKIVVTDDRMYAVDNDDETDDGTRVDIIDGKEVRTTFYSVRGVSTVSFGATDIGAKYEISITSQPFGRVCQVANKGSGTVTGPISDIEIRCDRDSTDLYHVTAAIDAAIAAAPPPGFKVALTTEEGTEEITPEAGQTSVTFTQPVFYPGGTNPPPFAYKVTASYETNGVVNQCAVENASGELIDGNADIIDVVVTSCTFGISAVVSYSQPAGAAGPAPALGDGLVLGVKDLTGAIVSQTGVIPEFSATPVHLPGTWVAHANAVYELTVLSQPEGQFCIVEGGGMAALVSSASAAVEVYCRDLPAEANRLTGTFRVVHTPAAPTEENPRPLATAPARHFMTFMENGTFIYGVHHTSTSAGVEHGFYDHDPVAGTLEFTVHTDSSGRPQPFVCRFDFIAGTSNCPAELSFFPTTSIGAGANNGLTGISGYPVPAVFGAGFADYGPPAKSVSVLATGVTKLPAVRAEDPTPDLPGDAYLPAVGRQLLLTFGTETWTLVEPIARDWGLAATDEEGYYWKPGNSSGAWVSADSKRVWVYDSGTTFGWHAGVNGAPNLQDMCFGVEQAGGALGYDTFYSRRISIPGDAFSSSCHPFSPLGQGAGNGIIDVPNANSSPALVPGFDGRFPGASTSTVVPASPAYFRVVNGANGEPDTLIVQGTMNGLPKGEPLVFTRSAANW